MNKLQQLIEAAKEAEYGKADFRIHPTFILELCTLLEKAEEGFHLISLASQSSMTTKKDIGADARRVLTAIKQWKEQT